MQMKQCPKCGFVNEIGGDECPRCGIVYEKYQKRPRQQAKTPTPANQEKPKSSKPADLSGLKEILGAACLLIAVLLLWQFAYIPWMTQTDKQTAKTEQKQQPIAQKKAPKKHVPTKTEASVMAEQFVRKSLKAPSTADFPWYNPDHVKYRGDNTWVVHSYVDAQNSFGAKLRTWYICELKYMGNKEWKCISLALNE